MARLDLIKCINSSGRTKYIVEHLATDIDWMKRHNIRLFEVEKPPMTPDEPPKVIEPTITKNVKTKKK